MKLLRYRILILSFFLISVQSAFAQWELGFGGIYSAPVDRFVGTVYRPGGGMFFNVMTGSVLSRQSAWRLQFGSYFDIQYAGSKSIDVTLNDPVGGAGQSTLNNYHTGQHLLMRYGYTVTPRWVVFTDLIVGHRLFKSDITTGLKQDDPQYQDDVQKIHRYNTWRHGVGFGARYSVGKSFGIEMRIDYTRGNSARYFDLKSVAEKDDAIVYQNESWPHTDLFIGTIAVNWKLIRSHSTATANNSSEPKTRDDYYDNYEKSRSSSSTSSTPAGGTTVRTNANSSGSSGNNQGNSSTSPTPKKKKVSSSKPIKEQEKEPEKKKEINW
ncbi:MAG: hypothetical protein GC181_13530 [Bacteroidetes bacterium]|nr:hypothetical protein [Bacteroidota bacterium]